MVTWRACWAAVAADDETGQQITEWRVEVELAALVKQHGNGGG